jgi:hypothetical protein
MTAKKDEAGKPDLSLVPHCVEVAIAEALMDGEIKYGRYNYCKGHRVSKLLAAVKRHVGRFQDGEDVAADSGLSHLSHALANLAMIVHEMQLGTLVDDRYKPADTEREFAAAVRDACLAAPGAQAEYDSLMDRIEANNKAFAEQTILLPAERYYEIVATGRSGDIILETAPDLTLAQNRLDALREEWPTFKLRIQECEAQYEDDDGYPSAVG